MRFKAFVSALFTIIFSLSVSASAFAAWPFDSKKKEVKAAPSSPSPAPAAKTQTVKSAPTQSSADEEDLEEETPAMPEIPQLPQVNIPEIPRIPQTKPQQLAFGKTAAGAGNFQAQQLSQDPEIMKIQAQIREIVKINESLKNNFAGQAAEIQKINDQSRIHQKILSELDTGKKNTANANPENFLNREKVRLIEEQTEKNQKFIADLKNQKKISSPVDMNVPGVVLPETEKKP